MNYDFILQKAADVLIHCDIHSFPIDCLSVMEQYGLVCRKYSEQSPQNQLHCRSVSDDAFSLKNIVFYNDMVTHTRIRFSLMHELGHHILGHTGNRSASQEAEANYFASNLLAPRLVIHASGCRTPEETAALFDISAEAALYAYEDCRRHSYPDHDLNGMNRFDQKLYRHFLDADTQTFVYHRQPCCFCGNEIVNSTKLLCHECEKTYGHHTDPVRSESDSLISDTRLSSYYQYGI